MLHLSLLQRPAADANSPVGVTPAGRGPLGRGGERRGRRARPAADARTPAQHPGGQPGALRGGPGQLSDDDVSQRRIAGLELGLRNAMLTGSGDDVAAAALALADALAHTPRDNERPALLRVAALRGGSDIGGRALLRLGAALAERGADDQARVAWNAAARQAEPAVAAAAELEMALADLAAGHQRRAQRALHRLASDRRDADIAVMARSTLRGSSARGPLGGPAS